METRWKKNLLRMWLVIVILLSTTVVNVRISTSAPTTKLLAPIIQDETLTAGSSFYIDITIEDISAMWGYSINLFYNTTVLTATSYSSYDPFTEEWPSLINDTGGYLSVSYSMELGEKVGFSTVQPAPIVRIDFTVNALGISDLYILATPAREELSDVEGHVIIYEKFDGFFANIAVQVHDIAVTNVALSNTNPAVGSEITVSVTVENQGDFDETFNVTVKYDDTNIATKTDVVLSVGATTTLTFTWDTKGIDEGTYRIEAEVPPIKSGDPDVSDELDLSDNTFSSDEVTISSEGGQQTDLVPYVIAGAAIAIVAIILVYFLRVRKPKST